LEQHYRPCLRCRPDLNIDYYNGNISGTVIVNTALKMIYDGYLNYNSLKDLSNELMVSDRHLRGLFIENLGVPPIRIAKYHRALFAKKLLMFSDQSITDIAFASGFGSIRQFNQVFKKIFGTSPSSLKKGKGGGNAENTTLLLPYQKPFNFSGLVLTSPT